MTDHLGQYERSRRSVFATRASYASDPTVAAAQLIEERGPIAARHWASCLAAEVRAATVPVDLIVRLSSIAASTDDAATESTIVEAVALLSGQVPR